MATQPDPIALHPIRVRQIDTAAKLWHAGWLIGHAGIVPPALVKFRDPDSFRQRISNSMSDCYVTAHTDCFIRIKGDELDQFYIAPERIGAGFAASVMTAAENVLRARGITQAHLIASVGNDRAMRFYERSGWRNAGQLSAGVETTEGPFMMDVIRFEKTL